MTKDQANNRARGGRSGFVILIALVVGWLVFQQALYVAKKFLFPGVSSVLLFLVVGGIVWGALAVFLIVYLRMTRTPPFGRCAQCGYNLRGNVSGVCPECGGPVPDE